MTNTEKKDRGLLKIDGEECKGCGLCVEACPPKAIAMNERLNHYGYRTAVYAGSGCTGCGICYMVDCLGHIPVANARNSRSHH